MLTLFLRAVRCAPSLVFFAISTTAAAQESQPLTLGVSAGIEYDDNVTVDQNDLNAGVSDEAAVLEANAAYKFFDNDSGSFEIGYDFSQSLHRELSGFDIQSHSFTANGELTLGEVSLGGNYSFFHLLLGGSSFLNMHMITPSVSGFLSDQIFVRGSYIYFDKNFTTANTRDATTHQPGVDVFYFFNNAKSYFSFGGRYEMEDTTGPEFDYAGYIVKANLQLPVTVWGSAGKINLGYQFLTRDYDNVTPSIGVARQEDRNSFTVTGEFPLIGKLSLLADYRFIDRSSNLASVNYSENVFTTSLKYSF